MNVQNKNNSSYVIIGIALLSSLVWRVSPSEMEGRPPFMCSDFPYRQYGTHFPYQAINYFQLSSNLFYSPHKHSIFQIHMSKYFVDKLMFVCLRQSFPQLLQSILYENLTIWSLIILLSMLFQVSNS